MANRRNKKVRKVAISNLKKNSILDQQYRRHEFVIEKGDDLDDPKQQITRLRRKCVYDEMLARGSINQNQRDAAEQYAIICEKSFGSSGDLYARANYLFSTSSRNNWEPSTTQSDAYDKLFKIWKEMGRYHRDILNMIVLGNMSTKEISQKLHLNLPYTMGQVLSTFIILEEIIKDL
ncbi:unnamed protein product [Commensalibacter communis]|uniref:Uncharacterized protein n=1 Tax=Commensalibacter communis TaxID=2972786 RepID=A0A9W4TQ39_9PROT|nr:hypothetical protein [Commensalibacter communis]CAI3953749.1 unnamed protein product [Commensalibacter communis]CAI3956434.1 unnamed protein product [Commensalibacter communis]CAI3956820.1 unnamed protein product [Commensalibacter communis]CAI3956833.1 unnamed protein product [Commensalibacter communis]